MNFYGVKDKDLVGLPYRIHGHRCLYTLATLEEVIVRSGVSKKDWLRHLVKVRARWEKAKAAKNRKKKFYDCLVKRAPELAVVVKASHYKGLTMEDKAHWYPRFEDVEALCEDVGLNLTRVLVSPQCKDFIVYGIGSAEDVVNVSQQN